MRIDRKGNIFLTNKSGKKIKLTNVLIAGDITGNLLSLRKFVEIGLSIKLDDRKIRQFFPEN